MYKRVTFIIIITVVFGLPIFYLFAASEKTPTSKSENKGIPDWVKRTNIAIEIESDQKPKYFLETIQPILGS